MLLDRIELFVNVAKHQSLAKTARGMHVSASSVSQRLKSLENDFGVKLYKRNKGGIELTHAGRTVLSTASQVLHELDELRKTLNPNSQKAAQRLVVGATYNPSARYLPSAIATFQKTHPDIKVTFLTSSRRTVEQWVRDGEVDIAMIQSPSESCIEDFAVEHVAVDTVALFIHSAHPLTKKHKLGLKDLADTPLIVREGTGTITQGPCFTPRARLEAQYRPALRLARCGQNCRTQENGPGHPVSRSDRRRRPQKRFQSSQVCRHAPSGRKQLYRLRQG